MATLARALSAVQRLASGEIQSENEDGDNTLSLLTIRRGSAHFDCVASSPDRATTNLRLAGNLVKSPEAVDAVAFAFSPIEDLSQIARSLNCTIELRRAGDSGPVLAKIGPTTFSDLARSLLLEGDTTIIGSIERVGGSTGMKCSMRVTFQNRLLYCDVATRELIQRLGEKIYQRVAVTGPARWIKNSWRVIDFKINELQPMPEGSVSEGFAALRKAGGLAWAKVGDPAKYLKEISGER